ncbi:hypothetical protein BDR03DRAFT_984678 [Suillus americanus]|nr:hypothetical protein BDR03DRAFT_984678 [Suillus americanus]
MQGKVKVKMKANQVYSKDEWTWNFGNERSQQCQTHYVMIPPWDFGTLTHRNTTSFPWRNGWLSTHDGAFVTWSSMVCTVELIVLNDLSCPSSSSSLPTPWHDYHTVVATISTCIPTFVWLDGLYHQVKLHTLHHWPQQLDKSDCVSPDAAPVHSSMTAITFTLQMSEIIYLETQSHVQYYGYAVSEKWLDWFLEKLKSDDCNDIDNKSKEYFKGLAYLANINNLGWKCCFNPNHGLVDNEELEDIPIDTIQVLYMYSDEEGSIQRPLNDEKKIKVMTVLLGHGPEWWMGCSD